MLSKVIGKRFKLRKGFTLFELLTIVLIFCLISGTGIMLFVQNLKNCENETYDIMVKEIIEITKVYLETEDVKLSL